MILIVVRSGGSLTLNPCSDPRELSLPIRTPPKFIRRTVPRGGPQPRGRIGRDSMKAPILEGQEQGVLDHIFDQVQMSKAKRRGERRGQPRRLSTKKMVNKPFDFA
jgi:hypothetical protein